MAAAFSTSYFHVFIQDSICFFHSPIIAVLVRGLDILHRRLLKPLLIMFAYSGQSSCEHDVWSCDMTDFCKFSRTV